MVFIATADKDQLAEMVRLAVATSSDEKLPGGPSG
jgi:hypothetical protein